MIVVDGVTFEADPKTMAVVRAALKNAAKIEAIDRGQVTFNVCGDDVRLHIIHEFCEPVKVGSK